MTKDNSASGCWTTAGILAVLALSYPVGFAIVKDGWGVPVHWWQHLLTAVGGALFILSILSMLVNVIDWIASVIRGIFDA